MSRVPTSRRKTSARTIPALREVLRARLAEHQRFLGAIEPPPTVQGKDSDFSVAAPTVPGYETWSSWAAAGWGSSTGPGSTAQPARRPEDDPGRRHAGPRQLAPLPGRGRGGRQAPAPEHRPDLHIGEPTACLSSSWSIVPGAAWPRRLDGTPGRRPSAAEVWSRRWPGPSHAAHAAGDRPPRPEAGNILLAADGTPKIADFGLAKSLEHDSALTASGSILGTPSYMAPEQAGGKTREVGPPADVYALGAILYELLVGRPPFRETTVLETLEQVKHAEPVPPSRLVRGLPSDIETIALKCLQKEPAKRYASAADLAEDLRRFQSGESIVARPVGPIARSWRWCRRNRLVASLLAMLTLAIVAGFAGVSTLWLQSARERESLRRQNAVTSVKLALHEFEASNIVVAEQHIDECPPDRRFFEWDLVKRLCHRERQTFDGHQWYIWKVAFSPGGDRIASVAGGFYYSQQPGQSELLIRDAATGQVVFERRGLRHGLKAAAFDPASNGRYLATGGGLSVPKDEIYTSVTEGRLDVWDTETGERRTLDEVKNLCVIDVAYSPDGAVLAAAYGLWGNLFDDRGYARLWDVATGKPIGEPFAGYPGSVLAVSFSPDGRWLAFAAYSNQPPRYRVEIWDWRKRELACPPFGADSEVHRLAFSPDGRFLASSEEQRLIRLWDATTGKEVRVFKGHGSEVRGLSFSPDGKILASCAEDHLVKLWDVGTGLEIESLRGHPSSAMSLAYDPEGRQLASGDLSGLVKVWDVERAQPLRLKTDGGACRVAFHPDGKRVVTGSSHGTRHAPQLWDLDTGRLLRSFQGHESWVESVTLSCDGSLMASGSFDRTVRVWDVETGRQLAVLDHSQWGIVRDVVFHLQDNTKLATACDDGTLRLWTIDPTGHTAPTSKVVDRLHTAILNLSFRPPMGEELAAGVADGSVHVWNVERNAEVLGIPDLGEKVGDVAFSPDGVLLATANRTELFRRDSQVSTI